LCVFIRHSAQSPSVLAAPPPPTLNKNVQLKREMFCFV
jgi:hypothetical protein